MNVHSPARFTPAGRALLVRRVTQDCWSVADAAEAAGVSPSTAHKWLSRLEDEWPPRGRRTRFLGLWAKRDEGAGKGGFRPGQRV
jgi:transposase-like protein